jgi:pimeloyl-ACP methyl ester carboxylesterase
MPAENHVRRSSIGEAVFGRFQPFSGYPVKLQLPPMASIRRTVSSLWPTLFFFGVLALVSGCATTEFVQLRQKPNNPLTERLNTTAFGIVRHSQRTDVFLRRTGYKGADDLKNMIRHAKVHRTDEHFHEATYSLAELNYLAAEVVRTRDPQLASELYLDSSEAAWSYFAVPGDDGQNLSPHGPEHRSTAEVYNASTEGLLRIAHGLGKVKLGQSMVMPLTSRRLLFEIPFPSRLLTPDQLGDFEFVSDYELKNLKNRHTTAGLGVPVIAIRPKSKQPDPVEQYYTQGMSFAATMVLQFDQQESTLDHASDVRLQIFDPRESDGFVVGNTLMPLETDVSTPLARYLSNRDISLLDTWGFFRPDRAQEVAGLYMVQPYDPDRIPVLMVHGIWSSPMTWMEMFNELQSDPEIRRKYQFWFYLYPTGEPMAFSAAGMRDELLQVRNDCDPYRRNEKLDEMVVVGHSMGGLMSHMLTLDSGSRLWNSVSRKPVDELQATSEVKTEIRRVFFFQSNPSIDRIVTIASPYGGSSFSNRFTRWLTGSFVWLPAQTYELTRVIFEENNSDNSWWDRMRAPKTSVDSLTKKSAVLTMIRDSKVPDEVKHHNIIGVRKGKNAASWTDGVVSYRSAHREDVTSEKVIPAGHREVLRHSETVDEVRRILLEHLEETQRRRFPVLPVRMTVEQPAGRASLRNMTP